MSHDTLWLRCALLVMAIIEGHGEMLCEPDAYGQAPSSESARPKLHQDILCEYDTEVQPEFHVQVTSEVFVRRARVEQRTLEMKVLLNLRWKDPFLTWDPLRYDNIEEMQIKPEEIWMPDVATVSTLPWIREDGTGDQSSAWPPTCRVFSNGTVFCAAAMDVGGDCEVSYLYWPHIEANCGTIIGTNLRSDKRVSIRPLNQSQMTELQNYVPDNDWVITNADLHYLNFTGEGNGSAALSYTFRLRSRGTVILSGLIGPAIVLSLLLLVSFSLPTNSTTRLGMCCCSTFGSVLASSLLFESLPPYDGPNPVIVTFYAGLLTLSAVAIIMTLLLTILVPRVGKSPKTPGWLYSVQSWLMNSASGQVCLKLLLLAPNQTEGRAGLPYNGREGNEGDPGERDESSDLQARSSNEIGPHKIWDFSVSFLNRSLFLIFLVACGTLCLNLVHSMATTADVEFSYE